MKKPLMVCTAGLYDKDSGMKLWGSFLDVVSGTQHGEVGVRFVPEGSFMPQTIYVPKDSIHDVPPQFSPPEGAKIISNYPRIGDDDMMRWLGKEMGRYMVQKDREIESLKSKIHALNSQIRRLQGGSIHEFSQHAEEREALRKGRFRLPGSLKGSDDEGDAEYE